MTRAIMFQGTGSDVGKSLLVAGLGRAYSNRGLTVRPFKPQNMSNNAAVTEDGGEIGRAQALQAFACRCQSSVHMNPVLLKPESDRGSQVIVQGKSRGSLSAREYNKCKFKLLPDVLDSFHEIAGCADLVLVEGAGSAAETNLRQGDIANMGFASALNMPVILIGDINRGGVIATLAGIHRILPDEDRRLLAGYCINKFRGDPALFAEGLAQISEFTGLPDVGLVQWFNEASQLPAEDSLGLTGSPGPVGNKLHIAVFVAPGIANFDDIDPLRLERDVHVTLVRKDEVLPGDCDLVILPGSKSTITDLLFFKSQGWDIDLSAHIRRGGHVLGICGGYQMLGKSIVDTFGIEGKAGDEITGLGYLDICTKLGPDKKTIKSSGVHAQSNIPVSGYEIHIGETTGVDCARSFLRLGNSGDGAVSRDGKISGTYLHGLMQSDEFRTHYLKSLNAEVNLSSPYSYDQRIDTLLDSLAAHLESHMDLDLIFNLSRSINSPCQKYMQLPSPN